MPPIPSPAVDLVRRRRAAVEVLVGGGLVAGGLVALALVALRPAARRRPDGGRLPFDREQAHAGGLEERDRALVEARRARDEAIEAGERTRVAREIQDLVTHGLTEITVQTAAARRLLSGDPDTADQILAGVERVGREATAEMRSLLTVLSPDEPPARHPQPDLSQLDHLVATARADGVQVELVIAGTPSPVDPGIALTAYRVVEEGLATAHGRAGCCSVRVTLTWRGDLLDVAVEQDGPAGDGALTGLRDRLLGERVRAYGGRLRTTARAGGGSAVHATFPTRRSAR